MEGCQSRESEQEQEERRRTGKSQGTIFGTPSANSERRQNVGVKGKTAITTKITTAHHNNSQSFWSYFQSNNTLPENKPHTANICNRFQKMNNLKLRSRRGPRLSKM
jgi:hypothetical protein